MFSAVVQSNELPGSGLLWFGRRLLLLVATIRIVNEYQRLEAGSGRLVTIPNLVIDPICYLAHDRVHPFHILWDNLRAWASLPLRLKPIHAAWRLLKGSIVNLDRDRNAFLEGGMKCRIVAHMSKWWPACQVFWPARNELLEAKNDNKAFQAKQKSVVQLCPAVSAKRPESIRLSPTSYAVGALCFWGM